MHETLEITAARLELGIAQTTDLPVAASRALRDGRYSPSLGLLAGLNDLDAVDEARSLLASALRELGFPSRRSGTRAAAETSVQGWHCPLRHGDR